MAVSVVSSSFQLSKSFLQSLKADPDILNRRARLIQLVQNTSENVLAAAKASSTKKTINCTSYIKDVSVSMKTGEPSEKIEKIKGEILSECRRIFPDCDIQIHETKGYNGDLLEAILIIDWT
jgi:hypothetical protein